MDRIGISHSQQKERILSLLKVKGPSLPVQIARAINVSPLFAGAFLSELFAEKRIRISNMRVGSSPLYYLEGQENLLERFVENLNVREREAFENLRREGVLEDDALTPVLRVALRAIKDFAIPVRVRVNEDVKLFWRHFLLAENEAREKVENIINPKPIILVRNDRIEVKEQNVSGKVKEEVEGNIEVDKNVKKPQISEIVKENSEDRSKVKQKREKKERIKKQEESIFAKKIRDYLSSKDIEILDVILEKKKEFIAKIRFDILFGKQEFLLYAKEKKKVDNNDLIVALHKANISRMPVLFIANGELDKDAKEYLKEWSGLLKYERVKL